MTPRAKPAYPDPIRSPDWMAHAECAGRDPEDWFPLSTLAENRRALAVCGMCPVTMECLQHVAHLIANGHEMHGIWAGRNAALISRQQARLIIERGK